MINSYVIVRGRSATPLLLLWLAGVCLRLTILAVPPVIPLIRDDFHLNATQVGLLGGIAPALFALAALMGSLLVAHLGVRRALCGGLLLVAIGSGLRGFSTGYVTLIATSIAMAAGVAIMQPVMPSTVRQWVPGRIGLGTAIYTNGLLVGEILPVMLTTALVLPLSHGDWRWTFVWWSAPVWLVALLVYRLAPMHGDAGTSTDGKARRWIPDWRNGLIWRMAVLFGAVNGIYFSANAFLPIYLTSVGRAELIDATLTALNFAQLPASLLLIAAAGKVERRSWPYVACGVASLCALMAIPFCTGWGIVAVAATLGFSAAAVLILGLALPALLFAPEDVARTAAGVFTISYGGALVVAVVCGAVWDVSGIPASAFVPLGVCAAALIAMPAVMRRRAELV